MSLGPRCIICLTAETTETLYLLGEEDRIVDISAFTIRPPRARRRDRLPLKLAGRTRSRVA